MLNGITVVIQCTQEVLKKEAPEPEPEPEPELEIHKILSEETWLAHFKQTRRCQTLVYKHRQ